MPRSASMPEAAYDSRKETLAHIGRVRSLLMEGVAELHLRASQHDKSKLAEPEKSMYDEFTPKLRASTYGSPEYKGFLDAMGPALQHHYEHNRHHPEFHKRGVHGMNLLDMFEMLADWKAASERHADGDLRRSILINAERFNYDGEFADMLIRTAEDLGWL
jgi:hypothetical protein